MNLENHWEMEKCRGYWRAKGFDSPVPRDVRLVRNDCHIVYRYNSWQVFYSGQPKPTEKTRTLNSLLAKIT